MMDLISNTELWLAIHLLASVYNDFDVFAIR